MTSSLTEKVLPTAADDERLAQQVDAIESQWSHLFPLRIEGHVRPYESQPFLFLSAFPRLTRGDAERVALAGRLFVGSMLMFDRVVDRPQERFASAIGAYRAQAMRFESSHLLYEMFPPSSQFWRAFRGYLVSYAEAGLAEAEFASGARPWAEYTEEVALAMARGKNGVAQATIAALSALSGDEAPFAPLAASVLHHYVAWQLWDDLCDWKDDLREGVPTLPITRVLKDQPSPEQRVSLLPSMSRELYYGGHAEYTLDLAIRELDEADRLAASVDPTLAWREIVARLRRECVALRTDIDRIVRDNVERARSQPSVQLDLPAAETVADRLAHRALGFLVDQWHKGFGEARHLMRLTQEEGFAADHEFHRGDVFQRALIADALCDARDVWGGELATLVAHEARYLLTQEERDDVGGWRYFPTVEENAADADDLAQVMQVLLRCGLRDAVVASCERPLGLLLRDRSRPDGSFETWIIPRENRTPLEDRQVRFNEEKWGTGPDDEVVANLLYALSLYDHERFTAVIERGCEWLESRQRPDGCWLSTWYFGPFYGTYVALRALRQGKPKSPAIAAAQSFLLRTQRIDGGWGMNDQSDPLSTALAILASLTDSPISVDAASLDRAIDCLERFARGANSFASVHFIKPKLSDPYGSRTVTAAYVLRAALSVRAHQSTTIEPNS